MGQHRRTSVEAIRERFQQRLDDVGWSRRKLALVTKNDPKNVQRWLSGSVETIPADFLGACHEAGFADARWLAAGEGAPDVAELEASALLQKVRALVTPRPPTSGAEGDDDLEEEVERELREDAGDPDQKPDGSAAGGPDVA